MRPSSRSFLVPYPYWLLTLLFLSPTLTSAVETVIVTITATTTATATAATIITTTAAPNWDQVSQDPSSYLTPSIFKHSILETTNAYRAAHNASRLTWNTTLVAYAKNWASTCLWEHSRGPYGENLAYGYPNATAAVQAWGDEAEKYDFDKPTGFSKETGHFTQLAWKGTREVGCVAVDCGVTDWDPDQGVGGDGEKRAQGWYVVCEYAPRGNVVGSGSGAEKWVYFRMNVQEGEGGLKSGARGCRGSVVKRVERWWIGIMVGICIVLSYV
ncbi:CAP domain-containing protein [Aspergillus egyptiacus]|nr:CAP domain-containing protein [Aspergillus egyptiacus]